MASSISKSSSAPSQAQVSLQKPHVLRVTGGDHSVLLTQERIARGDTLKPRDSFILDTVTRYVCKLD